jgi:hypothetical protein
MSSPQAVVSRSRILLDPSGPRERDRHGTRGLRHDRARGRHQLHLGVGRALINREDERDA